MEFIVILHCCSNYPGRRGLNFVNDYSVRNYSGVIWKIIGRQVNGIGKEGNQHRPATERMEISGKVHVGHVILHILEHRNNIGNHIFVLFSYIVSSSIFLQSSLLGKLSPILLWILQIRLYVLDSLQQHLGHVRHKLLLHAVDFFLPLLPDGGHSFLECLPFLGGQGLVSPAIGWTGKSRKTTVPFHLIVGKLGQSSIHHFIVILCLRSVGLRLCIIGIAAMVSLVVVTLIVLRNSCHSRRCDGAIGIDAGIVNCPLDSLLGLLIVIVRGNLGPALARANVHLDVKAGRYGVILA
mmetsp:Transcript_4496/g.10788  ORF Transcript_4496/g.10788 Transcript_4496/m.10788 type:complete len:295 (+) Transcript_4496:729-1613(+)